MDEDTHNNAGKYPERLKILEWKDIPEAVGIEVVYIDKNMRNIHSDFFGKRTLKDVTDFKVTPEQARKMLDEVLGDVRLSYPPANPMINAPLALIQVELETKRDMLKWLLGEK